MSTIKAKVEKSTASKDKPNSFCTKLVVPGVMVETAFGPVQGSNRTFYMFTTTQATVGAEGDLNLDLFDQGLSSYEFLNEQNERVTATITTLYPKRA